MLLHARIGHGNQRINQWHVEPTLKEQRDQSSGFLLGSEWRHGEAMASVGGS